MYRVFLGENGIRPIDYDKAAYGEKDHKCYHQRFSHKMMVEFEKEGYSELGVGYF